MPRKQALIPRVAPAAEEPVLRAPKIALSLEDRTALRAIFANPSYVKAWNNAQHAKPSVFTGELNSALGSVIANNRLHEIRGWEMFAAALHREIVDPVLKKPTAPDNYPDEGAIDKTPEKKK